MLRAKAADSAVPSFLLRTPFTVAEVGNAHALLSGEVIDAANFRRKLLAREVLEPAGERRDAGRPTWLFRARPNAPITFRRPILS